MIEITDTNFLAETSTGKVVVDCYAHWCGVCKVLKPKIEEIAKSKEDYKFCLLNVDSCPNTAAKLNIMNLPTVILFEEGKEVKRGGLDMLSYLEGK